jgi:hypothetical protein
VYEDKQNLIGEKLSRIRGWSVSKELFGDTGCDIHDFESYNYVYFLDNVNSLEDLVKGLTELSPLFDEALIVARKMTENDFFDFKLQLAHERKIVKSEIYEESKLQRKYFPIVLPSIFISAHLITEKYEVPLGVALIRIVRDFSK